MFTRKRENRLTRALSGSTSTATSKRMRMGIKLVHDKYALSTRSSSPTSVVSSGGSCATLVPVPDGMAPPAPARLQKRVHRRPYAAVLSPSLTTSSAFSASTFAHPSVAQTSASQSYSQPAAAAPAPIPASNATHSSFKTPQKTSSPPSSSTPSTTPGSVWQNRYKIQNALGQGSFGTVVAAVDRKYQRKVAVKIARQSKSCEAQACMEAATLKRLTDLGAHNHHIIESYGSFKHKGSICITFELLSCNLFQLVSASHFKGFSLRLVLYIGQQLLDALAFLQSPSVDIIHCDIKLENILLVDHRRAAVKLTDFGTACPGGHHSNSYVQSRYYRAPEVLLRGSYSFPIDMWSLGCSLVELRMGVPLFPGQTEAEQIALIEGLLGPLPESIVANALQRFPPKSADQLVQAVPTTLLQFQLPQAIGKAVRAAKARAAATITTTVTTIETTSTSIVTTTTTVTTAPRPLPQTPSAAIVSTIPCVAADASFPKATDHEFAGAMALILELDPVQRATPSQMLQNAIFQRKRGDK